MLKRTGAFLIDFLLTVVIAILVSFPAKAIASYDSAVENMDSAFEAIASRHGVSIDITNEQYAAFTEEELAAWEAAFTEIADNEQAMDLYNKTVRLSMTLTYVCLIVGVLVVEIGFPFYFANGQTPGKKIFGLRIEKKDGKPVGFSTLLIRSILGKLIIEYGIPVLFYFNLVYGAGVSAASVGFLMLATAQLMSFFLTEDRRVIHDFLASTHVVKLDNQGALQQNTSNE